MGTCLGHKLLHYVIAKNYSIFHPVSNETHMNRPINLTNVDSRFFKSFPDDLLEYAKTKPSLHFNHDHCVDDLTYEEAPILKDFYTRTAYADNGEGHTFVSNAESKLYPIYSN